jgi:hypothetical protein
MRWQAHETLRTHTRQPFPPRIAVFVREGRAAENFLRRPFEIADEPPVLLHGDTGELPGAVEGPLGDKGVRVTKARDIHAVCSGVAQKTQIERIAGTRREVRVIRQHDGRECPW